MFTGVFLCFEAFWSYLSLARSTAPQNKKRIHMGAQEPGPGLKLAAGPGPWPMGQGPGPWPMGARRQFWARAWLLAPIRIHFMYSYVFMCIHMYPHVYVNIYIYIYIYMYPYRNILYPYCIQMDVHMDSPILICFCFVWN